MFSAILKNSKGLFVKSLVKSASFPLEAGIKAEKNLDNFYFEGEDFSHKIIYLSGKQNHESYILILNSDDHDVSLKEFEDFAKPLQFHQVA